VTENKTSNSNAHKILSDSRKAGDILYLSGQIGIDPKTGKMAGDDIRSQIEQVVKNIKEVVEANGIGLERIIKTNCYLSDINDYDVFNEVYRKHFTSLPVRTCISVKGLPYNALCEIEAIALLRDSDNN
jgi:2-iminobutanoate/2-iminopropanoate deaminase